MDGNIAPKPSRLPPHIASRLRIPVIAAPMFRVSGPDLVIAACRAGVIGAFPAINPEIIEGHGDLDTWLETINAGIKRDGQPHAPMCPNLIMRNEQVFDYAKSVVRHGVEMVITSVGSPKPLMPMMRDAGIFVLADVATLDHAKKAVDAGVDGLVLLTAGAGGQTGWMNPLAYVRAVRRFFDGPIVLAGGILDGVALRAAEVLGCDLAYMGTKFIATHESAAAAPYKEGLIEASLDDIVLTKAFNGLWGSFLRPTIVAAGFDPDNLDESVSEARAKDKFGGGAGGPRRWTDIRSAGHSVSGITQILSVAELVEQTADEYTAAKREFA
jgi:nitronate monooxygenase